MKRMIPLILAWLAFVSCGLYPKYSRPETGVTYEDSIKAPTWQEMYTDPDLQSLIGTALQNATSLQAARLKVEEAEATLLKARGQFLPSLSAAGSADAKDGDLTAGINASWQLDIFGKARNQASAAKASLLGSQAYEQAVKASMIAAVARSYYTLKVLDAQLDVSIRTLDNWDRTIAVLESLKAAGKTNSIAILQAKAKKMKLESSSMATKGSIEMTENTLRSLVGVQDLDIPRGKLGDGQPFPAGLFEEIPLLAVASRPDVRAAEMDLAAAFYNTAAARSAFYPDIILNGSTSWASGSEDLIWSVIGNLTAPILNRNNNKAALKTAMARQEEARLAFKQALLDAGEEVNNAIAECRVSTERLEIDTRQRDALAEAVEKIELTMIYSSTNYLEVLTAQQSLLDAELGIISDIKTITSARIALYQAIGGGIE